MSNTESRSDAITALLSATKSISTRDSFSASLRTTSDETTISPIGAALLQRHDPDGRLIDALTRLPPGSELLEAWQSGPAALFAFLSKRWTAEFEPAIDPGQIRLDCGNARLRALADMSNDDVPLEQPAYEVQI